MLGGEMKQQKLIQRVREGFVVQMSLNEWWSMVYAAKVATVAESVWESGGHGGGEGQRHGYGKVRLA